MRVIAKCQPQQELWGTDPPPHKVSTNKTICHTAVEPAQHMMLSASAWCDQDQWDYLDLWDSIYTLYS